jgi:hypothetical protein
MAAFSFWIVTAGVPMAQVAFLKVARRFTNVCNTATTDVFGLLIYIDLIVVINPVEFQKFTSEKIPWDNFNAIFIMLALANFSAWAISLFVLESKIEEYAKLAQGVKKERPRLILWLILLEWAYFVFIVLVHYWLFTGNYEPWLTL